MQTDADRRSDVTPAGEPGDGHPDPESQPRPRVAVVAPSVHADSGIGTYARSVVEHLPPRVAVTPVDLPVEAGPVAYLSAAVDAARTDADVVHVQHEYGLFGPGSAWSWLFFPVLFALTALRGPAVVTTVHEVLDAADVVGTGPRATLRRAYLAATNRLLAATADELLFLSEVAAARFPHGATPRTVLAHGADPSPPVDRSPGECKAAFGYDDDDELVVTPGYVSPRKGAGTVLELARALPDTEFLLAGGAEKGRTGYVEAVRADAPPNVRVTGRLPERRLHAAVRAADLVVLPYHEVERRGFRNRVDGSGVFNLAAGHGRPVAASDRGYFRAVAKRHGFPALFDATDPDDVETTVAGLLADPDRREELAARAREFAVEHSFDRVGRDHADLYARLADRPRRTDGADRSRPTDGADDAGHADRAPRDRNRRAGPTDDGTDGR